MNIKRLPDLEELKKQLEKNPDMLDLYTKAETLIGPADSVDHILKLVKDKQVQKK